MAYGEKIPPGGMAPQYEDIRYAQNFGPMGYNSRQVQTRKPWWNPRYWGRKVWIFVVVLLVVVIAVVIGVAVGVSQANKKNAYPDYKALNYSLKKTCMSEPTLSKSSLQELLTGFV